MGSDMTPRKDRRFKQWNKTKITLLTNPRNSNGHPPIESFTYDLSLGGARLHTAESFEVGALLRLQIELVRTGELLRVECIVKWRRRDESANVYEMGVEFQHTSMLTVLSLMKNLHDRRSSPASPKRESAESSSGRS
jgi:c-di-GMP-binding flagellar brake protein YcgR